MSKLAAKANRINQGKNSSSFTTQPRLDATNGVIADLNERSNRQKNIVVFGLPSTTDECLLERVKNILVAIGLRGDQVESANRFRSTDEN